MPFTAYLLAVLLAAPAAPLPVPIIEPIPAPEPQAPPLVLEPWPAHQPLRMIEAPDWSDYRTYPQAARKLSQEGTVTVEVLVGSDGVPRDCRILASSGHDELDAGTCDVARRIRFEAARDADGKPVEASVRTRLRWLLDDPLTFGEARLTALLTLDNGRVSDCRLTQEGPVPGAWGRTACDTFAGQTAYYLGDAWQTARRATILVALLPSGTATEVEPPSGQRIASRRTLFELSADGEPRNCRTPSDFGFGTPWVDHVSACGFFLSRSWLMPGQRREDPDAGVLTIDVFVEDQE